MSNLRSISFDAISITINLFLNTLIPFTLPMLNLYRCLLLLPSSFFCPGNYMLQVIEVRNTCRQFTIHILWHSSNRKRVMTNCSVYKKSHISSCIISIHFWIWTTRIANRVCHIVPTFFFIWFFFSWVTPFTWIINYKSGFQIKNNLLFYIKLSL